LQACALSRHSSYIEPKIFDKWTEGFFAKTLCWVVQPY
jgi:hypothetical protein